MFLLDEIAPYTTPELGCDVMSLMWGINIDQRVSEVCRHVRQWEVGRKYLLDGNVMRPSLGQAPKTLQDYNSHNATQ